MATLATITPVALVAVVAPYEAPTFGTGMQAYNVSELHGQDFKMLRSSILEGRKRSKELSESILASEPDDPFAYNTVPPLRSYFVDMVFERGGEILPVPFDLDEE